MKFYDGTSEELRIGVVGYTYEDKFEESEAQALVEEVFDELEAEHSAADKTVVSGLTDLGIPSLAYEEADERGYKTVGIACEKAHNYDWFPVDEYLIYGEEWGDESQVFLNSIDILLRVGGGSQSQKETVAAQRQRKPVIEYEL